MAVGTTDKTAGSDPHTSVSAGVTSGTASDALLKAVAASSTDSDASGADDALPPEETDESGDTDLADTLDTEGADAGTTDQPAGTGASATGEAPQRRIEAAVRNARAEVEKKYEWAKGFTAQDVSQIHQAVGLVRALQKDPRIFLETLANDLGVTIAEGAGGRPAEAPKPFTIPKAALRSEDGRGAFSEEQVIEIVQGVVADAKRELLGEMEPLRQRSAAVEKAEKQAALQRQAATATQKALTKLRTRPHVTPKTEPLIVAKLKALGEDYIFEVGPIAALNEAYAQFLQDDVFPTLNGQATEKVRQENARKAAAARGQVDTSGGGGDRKPVEIKGPEGLAKHMERLASRFTA